MDRVLVKQKGLRIERVFTKNINPFESVKWVKRDCEIRNPDGSIVFKMKDVEVPDFWSQVATDILAQKYFKRKGVPQYDEKGNQLFDKDGKPLLGSEKSLKQVVHRLAGCWTYWGEKYGYFASKEDAKAFYDEIAYMLIHQIASPNSPQWFNTGIHFAYGIEGPKSGHFYIDPESGEVKESQNSYEHPQAHACFIQSIKDDLLDKGGIMDLWLREARVFKFGSGTGTNFSNLRAKGEPLSHGGTSSGVMSFLRIGDATAASIKSGGITRRAAKMVILNIDHPEIEDFIDWKVKEEKKLEILVKSGLYKKEMESADEAIFGYQSNNSVRVNNEFMKAVLEDKDWDLIARLDGRTIRRVKARYLWDKIAFAAWSCADPGLQFDTTINEWHTCLNSGRINASNPCSEYMFLDDTACNLASINLAKFYNDEKGIFDVERFKHAVKLWTIVLEITVLMAQYPSEEIAKRSYEFRTLGLGYTNLGSLLMRMGIPYDSEEARNIAAAITSIMTATSYSTSAELASFLGPFPKFEENRETMLRVVRNHRRAAYNAEDSDFEDLEIIPQKIDPNYCPKYLWEASIKEWDRALELGERYGYRNAQVTCIAPTGTISLVMDCDTTGIEPDYSLVKLKKLAGGGYLKIVNNTIRQALRNLGYDENQVEEILKYVLGSNSFENAPFINTKKLLDLGFTEEEIKRMESYLPSAFDLSFVFNPNVIGKEALKRLGIEDDSNINLLKRLGFSDEEIERANEFICGAQTIEGAPHLKEEHYPIFDCANKCGKKGRRYIDYMAHVKMIAKIQPFISGSISKTVNMPEDATIEDVKRVYMEAWKLGLKSISIYRDKSKVVQSLYSQVSNEERIERRRMPLERRSITHKFKVGNLEGYITVGLFEDNKPGEIFVKVAKEGSTIAGLMDAFSIVTSIALQYGVPLKVLAEKFINTRFEPSGWTNNPQIQIAQSIVDYIFKWLSYKFLSKEDLKELGLGPGIQKIIKEFTLPKKDFKEERSLDSPPCPECGNLMIRSGTCFVCVNCGTTSGCS